MTNELDYESQRARLLNVNVVALPGGLQDHEDVLSDSSWIPVPLSRDLPPTEPPTLLRVLGGSPLLYKGRTNSVVAESSSGKTWLAVLACLEVLENGGRVLWLDYETNARDFVERVKALAPVDIPDEWWSRVAYLNPSHRLEARETRTSATTPPTTGHALRWSELVSSGFDLAVIDAVTGAMSAEGLDTNSDADVETMFRLIANPLARSGSCVLMLDHVVKSKESRGLDARGSGRKREALSGAMLTMKVTSPWRRAIHDSVTGAFTLTVAKDRPGHIGAVNDNVATGVVTADPDGSLRIRLTSSDDVVIQPDARTLEAIVSHLRTYPGTSKSGLEDELGGNRDAHRNAREWLIKAGAILVTHTGNSHRLHLDEVGLARLGL